MNELLTFWTNILDGTGAESLRLTVETETGKPLKVIIQDRESLDTLAVFQLPGMAAQSIGQALMLGASMCQSSMQRDNGLGF